MKKTNITCVFLALALGAMQSCTKEQGHTAGMGSLSINLNAVTEFSTGTKSLNEGDYKNPANYTVILTNTNGKEFMNCKGDQISSNLPKELEFGSYTVTASFGKEYPASRDRFFCGGSSTIMLQPKEHAIVTVECKPTCGKVSAVFDSKMKEYYSDYKITYSGTAALGSEVVTWEKNDTEPYYLLLNEGGETVKFSLVLKVKEEYVHVDSNGNKLKTAQINGQFKLQRNKAYKLTVKPDYTAVTDGTINVSVTIDDSTNDRPITIEVPATWI